MYAQHGKHATSLEIPDNTESRWYQTVGSPNRRLDVSKLYYDRKYSNAPPELLSTCRSRAFAAILACQCYAFNDALSAAEMCIILKDMTAGRSAPAASNGG